MFFSNLNNAQNEINNLSKELSSLDQKVLKLKQNFELLMKDATQIKVDLNREEVRLILITKRLS